MFGMAYLATDWPYCFRCPDFSHTRKLRGSMCRFWVRKSAKKNFAPQFLGDKLFQDIPRRVAKFRENHTRDAENRWTKKEKITRQKQTLFAIAEAKRATVISSDEGRNRMPMGPPSKCLYSWRLGEANVRKLPVSLNREVSVLYCQWLLTGSNR